MAQVYSYELLEIAQIFLYTINWTESIFIRHHADTFNWTGHLLSSFYALIPSASTISHFIAINYW